MKRDLSLIRDILIDIEDNPAGEKIWGFEYEGKGKVEILEHVRLLLDEELIEGEVILDSSGKPIHCIILRMTSKGYEFLAKAKNDAIWKKVLAKAGEKGLSASLSIINGLLEALAKKHIGLE